MEKELAVNWDTRNNILQFDACYDAKTDTMLLQPKENRPGVSVDCGGFAWVRVDPKTGEIIGVEIEGFKKVFLKKYRKAIKNNSNYIRPIVDIIGMEVCHA